MEVAVSGFHYEKPFPLSDDATRYRFLGSDGVRVETLGDREFLMVEPEALTELARTAMHDVSFYLRAAHQESVASILKDPEATTNDKYFFIFKKESVACCTC